MMVLIKVKCHLHKKKALLYVYLKGTNLGNIYKKKLETYFIVECSV